MRVFDLRENGERGGCQLNRLRPLAKFIQVQTHIPKRVPFAAPVADFAVKEQTLLIIFDGAARLA